LCARLIFSSRRDSVEPICHARSTSTRIEGGSLYGLRELISTEPRYKSTPFLLDLANNIRIKSVWSKQAPNTHPVLRWYGPITRAFPLPELLSLMIWISSCKSATRSIIVFESLLHDCLLNDQTFSANGRHSADHLNTVERIDVPLAKRFDELKVTVRASRLPQGPQPYSLIITGLCLCVAGNDAVLKVKFPLSLLMLPAILRRPTNINLPKTSPLSSRWKSTSRSKRLMRRPTKFYSGFGSMQWH
jgi:hypothetical protein